VLLTSGSFRSERSYFLSLGFAEVLLKPIVRNETLRQALMRIVGATATVAPAAAAPATPAHPHDAPAPLAVPHPAPTRLEPGGRARDEAVPATAAGPPIAGRRILLAEDQPVNQKLALRVLARFGCVVDVAANGLEACALAERNDYDLVFMDCHMPEMDGFEATAAIRAREVADRDGGRRERHLPIVALTASVLKADRDRCFHSGMDGFISKPFRPEQLEQAVRRWTLPADPGATGPARAAA
jgi:CheY-like chemotaxis protein